MGARILERPLNQVGENASLALPCPSCGKEARYAGTRSKEFLSVLGPITLVRRYCLCSSCHQGFFPKDRALNVEGGSVTPGVLRMTGIVGAELSFEKGSEFLWELAGLDVSPKQVERVAEALGAEIACNERTCLEPDPVTSLPSTLYLGPDGTGIPMRREEVSGRSGKQEDGSAKTREVKLCVVWSAETTDDQGIPVRDEGSASYTAAIESAASPDTGQGPSDFAARVLREASRRRFDHVVRQVVVADGAPWIWNLASEHFPRAIQSWTSSMRKSISGMSPRRSSVRTARKPFPGSKTGMRNSTTERSTRSLPLSGSTLPGARRRENASAISKRTVTG